MSNKIAELRPLYKDTANRYYNFDYCGTNQNPTPRQEKIKTYYDIKPYDCLKYINGSKKINFLSTPGTHDSDARFQGPFSRNNIYPLKNNC